MSTQNGAPSSVALWPLGSASGHYPYKAGLLSPDVWWPESSHESKMVIGDQIPGDKKTAELCARCCNVAYRQAVEDAVEALKGRSIDVSKALMALLPNIEMSQRGQ